MSVSVPVVPPQSRTPAVLAPEPGSGVPRSRRGGRDAWFDMLRAAALVRVVAYHVAGWVWLPAVFPSMGIMFALAGSLMAVSLDRVPGGHWRVIGKRLKRLLPPLWLMAAILLPVMLRHGWDVTASEGTPLTWGTAWRWVLPLADPPGSAWGTDWVVPLWYIRTYLWFVLLSPPFLWMMRRWTKRVLAVPLTVLALTGTGLLALDGATGDVVTSLAAFGTCWLLGFAHHDGLVQRLPWRVVAPTGLALLVAGLGWALTHQVPGQGWNLDEIPVAQGLYSVGAVLLLLRIHPDVSWIRRRRVLGGLVALANARAMTIYLWNNVAIFIATPLVDAWSVTERWDVAGPVGQAQQFVVTWVLLGVAIMTLGWIEDVAAGRPVRLFPWPASTNSFGRSSR